MKFPARKSVESLAKDSFTPPPPHGGGYQLAIPSAVSIMSFFFAHEILAPLAPPLHRSHRSRAANARPAHAGRDRGRARLRHRRREPAYRRRADPLLRPASQRRPPQRLPGQRRPWHAPDRLRREELQGRRQGSARSARREAARRFHHQGIETARRALPGHALLGEGTRAGRGRRGPAHPARRCARGEKILRIPARRHAL